MSNVATMPAKGNFSLAPQSLEEAMRFAEMMSKAPIVPKDYQGNPGNILVAIQWGMELGLQPLQSMQSIAVINGRPSIWGDAMLALVRGSGLLEHIIETPIETGCVCKLKRKGEPEVVREFTVEDAKRAGLFGKQGPWQQHPKRMMQMRARAFALRDVFPDVLRGVHIAEESRDQPAEKDITSESSEVEAPKTRADKVRAALTSIHKEADPVPAVDLGEFVATVQRAETPEDMQQAKEMLKTMSGSDGTKAARAFKARLAELQGQQQQPANNEAPDNDAPEAMSYAEVAGALEKAENRDDFDAACDLIQHVGNATQRDELSGIVKRRLAEFKAQQ